MGMRQRVSRVIYALVTTGSTHSIERECLTSRTMGVN